MLESSLLSDDIRFDDWYNPNSFEAVSLTWLVSQAEKHTFLLLTIDSGLVIACSPKTRFTSSNFRFPTDVTSVSQYPSECSITS